MPESTSETGTEQAPPVWTYRGYRLRPGEFTTSMVHLYRAEITRANTWRRRLDATTNWAIVASGAAVAVAFSQPETHHSVIILNTLLITAFLFFEARRYRYYELWSSRIRLMETDFLAAMLVAPFRPDPEWATRLAESLLDPRFPISMWEAFGRRLRRNYIWLYLLEFIAWVAKLALDSPGVTSFADLVSRARLGAISGEIVFAMALGFNLGMLAIAAYTLRFHEATGEVLPRYEAGKRRRPARQASAGAPEAEPGVSPSHSAAFRFLAVVTTDQAQVVETGLKKALQRSVTALPPGNTIGSQATLLVPVAIAEIQQVRAIVQEADPQGVIVAIPAEQILNSQVLAKLTAGSQPA